MVPTFARGLYPFCGEDARAPDLPFAYVLTLITCSKAIPVIRMITSAMEIKRTQPRASPRVGLQLEETVLTSVKGCGEKDAGVHGSIQVVVDAMTLALSLPKRYAPSPSNSARYFRNFKSVNIMTPHAEPDIWIAIFIVGPLLLALWALRPTPKLPPRRR